MLMSNDLRNISNVKFNVMSKFSTNSLSYFLASFFPRDSFLMTSRTRFIKCLPCPGHIVSHMAAMILLIFAINLYVHIKSH